MVHATLVAYVLANNNENFNTPYETNARPKIPKSSKSFEKVQMQVKIFEIKGTQSRDFRPRFFSSLTGP
jgi:hypothetical protein